MDAFTIDWKDENNWLCLPICLIPRVLRHSSKCSASATLLVPQWPSAPFWPMLFPNDVDPADFISDYVVICKSELVVHPRRLGSSLFKSTPNTDFLALRLKSKISINNNPLCYQMYSSPSKLIANPSLFK